MQLGGTPPQLFDQARDGVADIVWTLPTYQAGRFSSPRCSSCRSWRRTPRPAARRCGSTCRRTRMDEFRGVKLLAAARARRLAVPFHRQAGDDSRRPEGPQGARADAHRHQVPDRARRMPVQMPVPQVPESLSQGRDRRRDGAVGSARRALKLQEITKYHLDTAPGVPKMSNSIFVIAMNPAQVRQPAAGPQEGDRRQQRPRLVEADRQDVRRHDRAGAQARARMRAACSTRCRPPSTTAGSRRPRRSTRNGSAKSRPRARNGQALLDDAKAMIRKHGG